MEIDAQFVQTLARWYLNGIEGKDAREVWIGLHGHYVRNSID